MSSKSNKDKPDKLLPIFFGAISIFILVLVFTSGHFSMLWNVSGSGRGGGVPFIFYVVLGLVALYYAIKD